MNERIPGFLKLENQGVKAGGLLSEAFIGKSTGLAFNRLASRFPCKE